MRAPEHSLPYRRELDGLRGIAILLVLLYHLWPGPFSFGYVGVDVFFVLSGYLITRVIATRRAEGRFRFAEFYRNRIRRIFPAMILVLLATLLAGYLFLLPDELSQLGSHVLSSAFFFQNIRLAGETGYWDVAGQLKPLLHFWSLSIEEQFYLFWPLLVGLLLAGGARRGVGLMLTGLATVAFLFADSGEAFFHSRARFWELAVGALSARLESNPRLDAILGRAPALPWALFALSVARARGAEGFELSTLVPVTIATALWIIRVRRHTDSLLGNRALVFLGLISFPLYLWHYPMVSFLHIFGIPTEGHGVAILAVSIGLAFPTYHFVENFFRRQSRPRYILSLVASVGLLGAAGGYVAASGGLPERAHVARSAEVARQFVRAANTDETCETLMGSVLGRPRRFAYCRATSSDPSARFVVLVGDSHAGAAYEGFAAELAKRGVQTLLLAGSGCPAFIDGAVGRDDKEIETCQQQIDQIWSVLGELRNACGVILAARGPKYMTGAGFGQVEGAERGVSIFRRTLALGPGYTAAGEYLRALESSLRRLGRAGIPAYVLLENPELGFSPRACLERPFRIFPTRCALAYDDYASRMHDYRQRVQALAADRAGTTLLDPEPLFCDRQHCFAMREGRMLYADDDHLSALGSSRQALGLVDRIALDARRGAPLP